MSASIAETIQKFAGLEVLIVGDAMLDSYLHGASGRLCPEAPIPVVDVVERRDAPGGAANTALNVQTLGARAQLLAVVGADQEAAWLREALERQGVSTAHLLVEPSRRTLAKHRLIARSQLVARFDHGSRGPISPPVERALLERLAALFPRAAAVIVSDYDYGLLTPNVIAALARLQQAHPTVLVVDAKQLGRHRQVAPTAVKPNYEQAVQLLQLERLENSPARVEQMAAQASRLLELTGARIAAITLDTDGALTIERGRPPYRTYARPRPHTRATGAGDTFVAALALALAAGAGTTTAAEIASAAAAVVVEKDGTATCAASELWQRFAAPNKHVGSLAELLPQVEAHRRQGRRIVFTNGCFDLLHRGHITYLSQAKALGDVLIIGLNSDASIRRLKGPGRPINRLEDRAMVLAALSSVDYIIPFDEDRPDGLIRAIRPDVYVKGGDYTPETLPEARLVEALRGTVRILPYLDDHSTTSIIARIRADASSVRPRPATTEATCSTRHPGTRPGASWA